MWVLFGFARLKGVVVWQRLLDFRHDRCVFWEGGAAGLGRLFAGEFEATGSVLDRKVGLCGSNESELAPFLIMESSC